MPGHLLLIVSQPSSISSSLSGGRSRTNCVREDSGARAEDEEKAEGHVDELIGHSWSPGDTSIIDTASDGHGQQICLSCSRGCDTGQLGGGVLHHSGSVLQSMCMSMCVCVCVHICMYLCVHTPSLVAGLASL